MIRWTLTTLCLLFIVAGCEREKDGRGDGTGDQTRDADEDGYTVADDCDDSDPEINPGATEVCDGQDNDCDDLIDDDDNDVDVTSQPTWYVDSDYDGYGADGESTTACEPPWENGSREAGDCDDRDDTVNPAASERCDDKDNDCDGEIDEDPIDGTTVYVDGDGDGYGEDGTETVVCDTTDYAEEGGDCDDEDDTVYPDGGEICFDGADNDCDDESDEGCPAEYCGDITEDTTWTADSTGYFVSCDINIAGPDTPTLTIEPGVVVYFAEDVGMSVGSSAPGGLRIEASDDPVVFTSGISLLFADIEPSPGDWNGLVFGDYASGSATIVEGLSLWYAGGEDSEAALSFYGADIEITASEVCASASHGIGAFDGAFPTISDTVICDNVGYGFYADDSSGLYTFSGNIVRGNGSYPLSVLARYGGALDDSSTWEEHDDDLSYIELRGDEIEEDVTLAPQGYPFYVPDTIVVAGSRTPVLTISDGVVLAFAPGAGLEIGSMASGGDLTIDGTGDGVVLTASNTRRGWEGLTVQQGAGTVDITGLTLSYGGNNDYGALLLVNGTDGASVTIQDSTIEASTSAGLYVGPGAMPLVTGSTFQGNETYGIQLADSGSNEGGLSAAGEPSFVNNTLYGNSVPMRLPASALGQLDPSSTFVDNLTDFIEVTGSEIDDDATWQAMDVAYYVLGDIYIGGSSDPIVEIGPGATFYIDESVSIEVGNNSSDGGLSTQGTSDAPVVFTSVTGSPGSGNWRGITFGSHTLDSASTLEGARVLYAGDNGNGAVYIIRVSPTLSNTEIAYSSSAGVYVAGAISDVPSPDIEGCTIHDNADEGIAADSNSLLGSFVGNTITANGGYPVSLDADAVGALDSASTYAGNDLDWVYIASGSVTDDATWSALDVPYYIDDEISVYSSATLEIAAGTTLEFGNSGQLTVGYIGYAGLEALGTAAKPIILTSSSDSPEPGDWVGLYLRRNCTESRLRYVEVTYADYGLYLDCGSKVTVESSTFENNDRYDLYCSSRVDDASMDGLTYSTNSGCDI